MYVYPSLSNLFQPPLQLLLQVLAIVGLGVGLATLIKSSATTDPAGVLSQCGCHSWHSVFSSKGTWNGSLTPLTESSEFLDANCQAVTTFQIPPNGTFEFGFLPAPKDNFDGKIS